VLSGNARPKGANMTSAGRGSYFDQFSLGPKNKRVYSPVAEPQHPKSITLVEFWRDREKAGGLIVGRDLPSRAIAAILRNLIVYEPIDDCSNFRVRHAGTAYVEHYGFDVTGKLMSELFDDDVFGFNCAKAKEVIHSGAPEVFDANLSEYGISRRHYEVVLLPVWGTDERSKWMLCGIFRFE
jgi:hypothetical protein